MKRVREWLGLASPSVDVNVAADIERRRVERILNGAGFREYERPEGVRGTAAVPEYRVTDYWSGYAVDEGFTFSKENAERMMVGALNESYDVELHVRTDGDWIFVDRIRASE